SLIIGLMAVVVIGVLVFLGPTVTQAYAKVVGQVGSVTGVPGPFDVLGDQSGTYLTSPYHTAIITWTEAPGALRYAVELRTLSCDLLMCSTFKGGTYEAGAVCANGTCRATITNWSSGRYLTLTAIGPKGTRTVKAIVQSIN